MASFPKAKVFRDKVVAEGDGGYKVGKTSKLRMTHAVCELLVWNEREHATDDELKAMLEAEFPKREAAGKAYGKKNGVERPPTIQSIAAYRAYYNAGKHGFGDGTNGLNESPKLHSSSYNAEGVARAKPVAGGSKPKAKAKGKGKGKAKKPAKKASKAKPVAA